MSDSVVPVVDFSSFSLDVAHDLIDFQRESSRAAIALLHDAFQNVGFVFVTNHGITESKIGGIFDLSDSFFALPVEVKEQYRRPEKTEGNDGYVSFKRERVDTSKPHDLKEAFQIQAGCSDMWPAAHLPDFEKLAREFSSMCQQLANRILKAMGLALALEDSDFFVKAHQLIGTPKNATTLRLLHYPPLPHTSSIEPGQLRCGEHTDYGSITLLFQDAIGGLEVKTTDGGYVPVPYMPGAALVNLGALMQQWTSDKYMATKHKVLVPESEEKRSCVRRSIAFFVHPDDDVMIECLDGSRKYPPITSKQYLDMKLNQTY